MHLVRTLLLLLALIATALLAGFFYAYESSVNFGLEQLDARAHIEAMVAINDNIPNGPFVLSFVGAPLLVALALLVHLGTPRLVPIALALVLVAATIIITVTLNVPLNNELADVDLDASSSALDTARNEYASDWGVWNLLRTITCSAALIPLAWAWRRPGTHAGAATDEGARP